MLSMQSDPRLQQYHHNQQSQQQKQQQQQIQLVLYNDDSLSLHSYFGVYFGGAVAAATAASAAGKKKYEAFYVTKKHDLERADGERYFFPKPATPSKPKRNNTPKKTRRRPIPTPTSPPPTTAKTETHLPPRPPSSNPLKRKLNSETLRIDNTAAPNAAAAVSGISDSGVKVVVRMRPSVKEEEEGKTIVQKLTSDSLSINGQTFTFDSVASSDATQLVGAPLVENCLAGFNSSVFAYGQTGSGKTYTIWGPANALLEENLSSDQQGLTPRVFERLFARINEEQLKHADKQLKYQCQCSFLEIYNEQVTDLLDPNQRNLQIREDAKSGVYVENLTEKYVSSMKDATQLLIKGVADGVSSFKTSRINLVDLAGSERQKLTGAAGERLKEAGNINRSLSQLGNLINILAEVSQTGKNRHIPYRDSKLTFLLQESLGGNAKLAMVCAISPEQSCKNETFSTLRFAQRAKAIRNKAVINEVKQNDVHYLREVIQQLRDELNRMRGKGNNQTNPDESYSTGWNARRSLNLLKFSLHQPRALPHDDEDGDEEMEIDKEAVEDYCAHVVGLQSAVTYQHSNEVTKLEIAESGSGNAISKHGCAADLVPNTSEFAEMQDADDTDVNMEEEISEVPKSSDIMIVDCANTATNTPNIFSSHESVKENPRQLNEETTNGDSSVIHKSLTLSVSPRVNQSRKSVRTSSMYTTSQKDLTDDGPGQLTEETTDGDSSVIIKSPTLSVSPRVNQSRKSLRTSSMYSASQKDLTDDDPETTCVSFTPTEHLAASLHRGLEILDSHRQNFASRRLSFRFSLKPADSKSILPANKVDVGVQTFPEEEKPVVSICSNCRQRTNLDGKEEKESSNLQSVLVDEYKSSEKIKKQVPKARSLKFWPFGFISSISLTFLPCIAQAVEKVLAGSIRREMALEEFCAKQASEIMQLNRLVQQYKHERECNAIIGQTRKDKILRLQSLMDGVLPTEEFMEEELASLTHEHKLLKENTRIIQREVLLEEIQDLRNQLQYHVDSSSTSARRQNSLLKLTYSCEPNVLSLRAIPETNDVSAEEKFEQERIQWAEAESKWISLVEELRTELDASQLLAEKRKQELDMEKNEQHMQLLARHRNIQEGIDDVKKAAAKEGVKGAESKFINALAAEISALKVEREKERRYLRDENRGLQAQLRDTAEAVQAAVEAEHETEKACRQIDKLKRKHEHEIGSLNELLTESRLPKDAIQKTSDNVDIAKHNAVGLHASDTDWQWRQAFEPLYNGEDGELNHAENSSWFSGYDRCNI
ncbi:Kinesin-like protein KIN12A [Hibiscus syriacus]|uniref:Kinesin-like protein KIN12A n=1 Tax=Hibiscus syriacus TaxID=106335 RepID=A0A6A3CB31_HIBSY|nr:Kinesin-like protein KIN12A [Hibiscus syriacus]